MIHVGIVSRTATYWPLYLLAREGVVDLVELGSTAAGVDALLEHGVDVAATCPDVLIARGAPLRVAAGLVDRPPAWLVARAEVASVADLRGRRVATTAAEGSVSIFLRAFLRSRGLARGDYAEVVVGPTPLQASALEHGVVDAAMLTAPIDERLVTRGFRRLAHVGDALGPCAFTTLNVRTGWASSRAWVAFRDAFEGAIARVRDDGGRARELPVLAAETRSEPSEPPHITYDARVEIGALERLLGFLRAEGVATSEARAYIEA